MPVHFPDKVGVNEVSYAQVQALASSLIFDFGFSILEFVPRTSHFQNITLPPHHFVTFSPSHGRITTRKP
jgi:hypothetical protein